MKVVVLGATGGTGLEIVRQAMERGHSVTAFVRSSQRPAYLLRRLLFPSVVADASAMEEIFQKSQLDWTLVRPPRLTDGRHSGKYRVRERRLRRFGFSISRADVADCFLSILDGEKAIRKIVGASY